MYLFLRLDQFYVDDGPPHAVLDAGRVLDSNKAARQRGVMPGTSEREARSLLRGDGRFETLQADQHIEHQREWLDRCLLYSSRIEPESPASAWVDLNGHPNSTDAAALLLRDIWIGTVNRLSPDSRSVSGSPSWRRDPATATP